jgi:hypothetical protein
LLAVLRLVAEIKARMQRRRPYKRYRYCGLRDGAFVVKTKLTKVQPVAHDRDRERRLWEATAELLERADAPRTPDTAI